MHTPRASRTLSAGLALCAAALPLWAQTPPAQPDPTPAAQPQVVQPQVQRREVRLPDFPTRNLEVGLVGGLYVTQNFGSSAVGGLRLAYHVTEDFFAVVQLGQTQVDDASLRQILPGGVLANGKQTLRYVTAGLGYNLLPGEVFLGRSRAFISQAYVLAGVGSTDFASQRKQTVDVGVGLRLYLNRRVALHAELRDHMFALDLLGRRETTHNPEFTLGLNVNF